MGAQNTNGFGIVLQSLAPLVTLTSKTPSSMQTVKFSHQILLELTTKRNGQEEMSMNSNIKYNNLFIVHL